MTMTMTSSQFGLEDMEALLWEPSTPMADAMGSLFYNPDQEEHPKIGGTLSEGNTSPVSPLTSSSLSSSSSPPPFYSPPPSPMAVLHPGGKDENESDMLSIPWLVNPEQLRCHQMVSDDRKEDVFGDLDWMTEKMDLSEIDLESLIGSCSPTEESPNSTEDLLASLECPMELDSLPMRALSTTEFSSPPSASLPIAPSPTLPTVSDEASVIIVNDGESIDEQESPSSSICVPEPEEELEIKSEPDSPESSTPVVESPPSPVYTLDLGSEVDVSESEVKPVLATVIPQVQRLVFSLSPTRIVLVLAPRNEVGVTTTTVTTTSEVARSSPPASPVAHSPQRSSRGRPYPEPKYRASPPSPSAASVKVRSLQGSDEEDDDVDDESVSLKAPKSKKIKKMEQNKTAATRYRQKKRAEQEALITEHTQMERKNVELKEKAESMVREIEYLKELIEEVRLARIKKGLGPDL